MGLTITVLENSMAKYKIMNNAQSNNVIMSVKARHGVLNLLGS